MSLTLCGEALTFAHDATLLGICLDSTDEPVGESFDELCANKNNARHYGHVWFDSRDPVAFPQDLVTPDGDTDVDADDEGSYVQNEEVRGGRARFCAMNEAQQTMFMYKVTMHICALIGVSICDWEPSDEFVLDAIENDLSDEALTEIALAMYYATAVSPEGNPSDEDHEVVDVADFVGDSQRSSRVRTLLTYDEEEARANRSDRRGLWLNSRNRACFYSNRRALSIRRNYEELFFADDGAEDDEPVLEMMDEQSPVTAELPREEFTQEEVRLGRSIRRVRRSGYADPWDLGPSFDRYDDMFDDYYDDRDHHCLCPSCTGRDWDDFTPVLSAEDLNRQSLIDRFGGRDDDDDDDFRFPTKAELATEMAAENAALDALNFPGSRLRLTGRYRVTAGRI